MKRIVLAFVLFACSRQGEKPQPRQLTEAPPPPALQLPKEKDEGFTIAAGRPQGKLTGTARPTITFSEPVVALETLAQQDPSTQIRIDPPVAGQWHWLGSSSVEFVADKPFPLSTVFHVVVPAGFKALDGTPLETAWQMDFTTPTVAVDKYATAPPAYLCKWSTPSEHFKIVVNQPLKDAQKAFFFEAGDEKRMVAAQVVGSEAVRDGIRYEIAPAQPLPSNARFAVGLDGDAQGVEGTLPAGTEWRQECHTMGPMQIAKIARCFGEAEGEDGHCSHGPVSIDFTNPLGPAAELRKRIHIEPPVELEWDESAPDLGVELQQNRTRAVLFGKFRPGTKYAVHVDPGVEDRQGGKAPAAGATLQMDDLLPSLYVGQPLALLEPSGDGQLPVQVTNLSQLQADLWAVTPQEMAQLETGRAEAVPSRPPDAPLRIAPDFPRNEPHVQAIDLRAALRGAKTGLVVARLRAPGTSFADHPLRVLAQITDLAVHVKLGATSSLAWVTSVQGGQPVQGAKINALSASGGALAEATTDANGIAALPGYASMPGVKQQTYEAPRVLVSAALGGDVGYVTTRGYGDDPVEVNRNFDALQKEGLGLVFADRGIYRPGDTVHLKGVLREREGAQLQTPSGATLQVKVTDPEGKDLLAKQVTLSRYGTFTLDAELPKAARLGQFNVVALVPNKITYGYGTFLVAEYRAPQFRVDVQTPMAELTAGEELSATVIARYLFGGAMERAQVQWSVARTSEDFTPPKNDGFRFGRQTWNWDDHAPARDNGVFATGRGEVGKDGTYSLNAGKAEALTDRPARYTLEAEVADVSRQTAAGRASVLVHPAAYYVGLGAISSFAKAGDPLSLPVIAVNPAGEKVAEARIHLSAFLRSWHAVRKRGVNGIYETLSEPVEEKASECDAQSGQTCTLAVAKPGFYNLRAESRDGAGRLALTSTSVYAIGAGFAAWQQSDSPRVEVVADKSSYEVGETAHLLIKSPYPSCRALVTVEREGVSDARVVTLNGTASTIEVPIRDEHVPNVYVGVILVRERVKEGGVEPGDDPGRPSMRIGYANLKVGTATKRLKVSVTTSKAEYRPREKVPVDVSVSAPAEVQLYAVDEAVLRLTGYQVPDATAAMFPEHALATALGEPLPRLVRQQKFGEKGEVQPGGGGGLGPPGDVRSRFVTTVLWQTLTTGADGKAHAEIELPDNLTTFRLMAVATAQDDHFGNGETSLRVSLPLLVLPALPRFARTGDEFEAGVAIHSVKQLEVKVSASATGLELLAPHDRTVTVEAGVAKEVRFKFKAAAAGTATLQFRAVSGDLADAVEQQIPIELPIELEAVAVAGDTSQSKTEALVPPQGVRRDVGGLSLSLSSTALGGMNDAIDQLVDYPYGCLEQLSSRLVPYVALREVERVFGEPAHPDPIVADTVAKIEQLQTPGGGFLYWPSNECPYPWPSIYATLALFRAQQMHYPVHQEVLARAKRYLTAIAAGEAGCARSRPNSEERIFALQTLARMGDPKPSDYDELYAEKDKLPLFAKAQLADAIAVGKGKRPRAEALLQDLLDAARETPRDLHFEESKDDTYAELLSSDTRTTGMVLQTLLALKPGHPYVSKIARYLTGVRKGGAYRNTQEAAYSLMALAELVRIKERTAPDFAAQVSLGGREIATAEFRKRTLDVIKKEIALRDLPLSGKQLPLEFKLDGTGSLYYTALLKYAPAELPRDARNEGLFVQRWFEPFGEPGKQATQFAAGELVRVRVRVATPQERNFLALEVPLPAGLEAVDTALATARVVPRAADEEAQDSEQTEGGFWSPFSWNEKRDDRVIYFADHLPPGVHSVSFVARATTPGTFVLKPAHAAEMYAPEVFGRTGSGTLSVVAQVPLAGAP